MNKLNVAGIVEESIVDGPGIRLTVFVQGCTHNCKGCHNPETHSFEGGEMVDIQKVANMIDNNPLLDGLTISGGEPFQQAEGCAKLAKYAKEKDLNVITYTGYTFEELLAGMDTNKGWRDLIEASDVIVDGKFEQSLRSVELRFRGSSNQRIISVKDSFEENTVVTISY